LCEDWPKLALPPVSEAYSPMMISPWAKIAEPVAINASDTEAMMKRGISIS
jgi:hypothetical protein